jgi:hypothetical protein
MRIRFDTRRAGDIAKVLAMTVVGGEKGCQGEGGESGGALVRIWEIAETADILLYWL